MERMMEWEPLNLHIGGRSRAPGWKTLNIAAGSEVDYVGDCSDLSQFATDSVDEIYASHVLEHVSFQGRIEATLTEWLRVLCPGGKVMISVPDFDLLCRMFVRPDLTISDRFEVMKMIFGAQVDPHDLHRTGLSWEFLEIYLRSAGFRDITRVENFGLFSDSSCMTFRGSAISLNVMARKPLPASLV